MFELYRQGVGCYRHVHFFQLQQEISMLEYRFYLYIFFGDTGGRLRLKQHVFNSLSDAFYSILPSLVFRIPFVNGCAIVGKNLEVTELLIVLPITIRKDNRNDPYFLF